MAWYCTSSSLPTSSTSRFCHALFSSATEEGSPVVLLFLLLQLSMWSRTAAACWAGTRGATQERRSARWRPPLLVLLLLLPPPDAVPGVVAAASAPATAGGLWRACACDESRWERAGGWFGESKGKERERRVKSAVARSFGRPSIDRSIRFFLSFFFLSPYLCLIRRCRRLMPLLILSASLLLLLLLLLLSSDGSRSDGRRRQDRRRRSSSSGDDIRRGSRGNQRALQLRRERGGVGGLMTMMRALVFLGSSE